MSGHTRLPHLASLTFSLAFVQVLWVAFQVLLICLTHLTRLTRQYHCWLLVPMVPWSLGTISRSCESIGQLNAQVYLDL